MDFTLSDEQQLLREDGAGAVHARVPVEPVRAHVDDPAAADPLWKRLQEWTALADGSAVDLGLFLEEAGAAVAPGPFFATTALFAPVVAAAGTTCTPG